MDVYEKIEVWVQNFARKYRKSESDTPQPFGYTYSSTIKIQIYFINPSDLIYQYMHIKKKGKHIPNLLLTLLSKAFPLYNKINFFISEDQHDGEISAVPTLAIENNNES